MALKATVDSLDQVDEQFHPLYEEADGKYRLAVEGLPDTGKLENTVAKLRQERDGANTNFRKLKEEFDGIKSVVGDLDVESLQEILKERKNAEEEELRKKGELETLYQQRYEALEAKHKKELEKANADLERARNAARTMRMRADIAEAMDAIKVSPEYRRFGELEFRDRAKVVENGEGELVTVVEVDGEQKPLTDWAKLYAETEEGQRLVAAPRNNGAGPINGADAGSGGVNPWRDKDPDTGKPNLTRQAEIIKQDPEKARRLAQAAGVKPTW